MTDETPTAAEPNQYDLLKTEMQTQFAQLKDAFEQSTKEKEDLIATLKQQNEELQRALVRSAFTTPTVTEDKPKSVEELHQDEVDKILNKAKSFAKMR